MTKQNTPQTPRFGETRWSLVTRASGDGEVARRALEELCATYWYPLYTWCRRNGANAADAEDQVQGFFQKILEKQLFADADATRGKLRTFLLTALQRHVRDEQAKAYTQRRGGGKVISFEAAEADEWYSAHQMDSLSAEQQFDREWAQTVLRNAMKKVAQDYEERGKTAYFQAMKPYLSAEGSAAAYEEAGRPLGQSAGSFKVAVHRMRTRFRSALREEVAETQGDDADLDGEIAYLAQILGAA